MSPIQDLEARLGQLDDAFRNAPSEGDGARWMPPAGVDYQCFLREIDFFEAKATGKAFLKMVFEIAFGEFANREIDMLYNLEPDGTPDEVEMRLGFLKRDLKTLGVPVDSDEFTFAQVRPGSPIWDDILDVPVEIAVRESKKVNEKTGKPFVNSYLNARMGDPMPKQQLLQQQSDVPGEMPPAPTVEDDESIPF
jgi:hypothetical protein